VIPSRLLPPVNQVKSAPALLAQSQLENAQPAPAATISQGVSAKLARTAPARDAFAKHRDALTRGIAGHEVIREREESIAKVLRTAPDQSDALIDSAPDRPAPVATDDAASELL
jgi:hypothetical protein